MNTHTDKKIILYLTGNILSNYYTMKNGLKAKQIVKE